MLDVLTADYVRTARSKGLAERAVIIRHAIRNALLPVMSTFLKLCLGLQATRAKPMRESVKIRARRMESIGKFIFISNEIVID